MIRSIVSSLAGAALFLFVFWVVAATLGSAVAVVAFALVGVALLGRRYARRRGASRDIYRR